MQKKVALVNCKNLGKTNILHIGAACSVNIGALRVYIGGHMASRKMNRTKHLCPMCKTRQTIEGSGYCRQCRAKRKRAYFHAGGFQCAQCGSTKVVKTLNKKLFQEILDAET